MYYSTISKLHWFINSKFWLNIMYCDLRTKHLFTLASILGSNFERNLRTKLILVKYVYTSSHMYVQGFLKLFDPLNFIHNSELISFIVRMDVWQKSWHKTLTENFSVKMKIKKTTPGCWPGLPDGIFSNQKSQFG
jgi:hypothetical protein